MIKKIFKFLKILFWLLLLLLIGIIIYGAYNHFKEQYNEKKNIKNNYTYYEKNEKSNKDKIVDNIKNFFDKNKTDNNDSDIDSNNSDNTDNINNSDANINAEYNTYNFDLSILLFEGEQKGNRIIELLDRLIKNADDNLYTNTKVSTKNINSNLEIIEYSYKIDNKDEYKTKLENVKNSINSDSLYEVSFGYSKHKSHVNEIIIEKK